MSKKLSLHPNRTVTAQPGPSVASMEALRQKPQRPLVPLSAEAVAGDAGAFPHADAEAESLPTPIPADQVPNTATVKTED